MLTEFLKSIRGEKALWETIITGVDVCNFRLQGNTKDPFIPISLQPLHFEVFFCFAGHVVLKQQWNRVVVVRKQEILLLSEVSSLYSVACTADLAGILVSVDATTAKESLYSLCRMMGDLKLNTFEVKKYMDKQDGCAVIHGSSWVFSTFSEIVKMEDFQKSRYCVWKSVELLFLLSTGTLYPKDKDNLKISKVEYIVAHGIASTVNEERVLIGSAHFIFEDEGVTVPLNEQERFDRLPEEYSHLYLAIGRELAAVICISDPLRREAKEVLTALRALGIQKTVMLTGDSYRTASTVANRLGVDAFCAEVLPADKAKFVADLRQKGHIVLMVGDGINDSPALSEADAGIAISDGAAIAREIADITIAADSLWELVKLRRIAMALMERIHSNYRFVIGFNGTLIGLGLAGILPPAASAALHNLSTLGVSLRSMSALPEPKQDNDRCI